MAKKRIKSSFFLKGKSSFRYILLVSIHFRSAKTHFDKLNAPLDERDLPFAYTFDRSLSAAKQYIEASSCPLAEWPVSPAVSRRCVYLQLTFKGLLEKRLEEHFTVVLNRNTFILNINNKFNFIFKPFLKLKRRYWYRYKIYLTQT